LKSSLRKEKAMKKISKIILLSVFILFSCSLFFIHSYSIVDGADVTRIFSVKALTVNEILSKAKIGIGENDVVIPGLVETLYRGKIVIGRTRPVHLIVDGKEMSFFTEKKTVQELLNEKNTDIGDKDYVNFDLESRIYDNQEIIVKHYMEVVRKVEIAIPFTIVYRENRLLEKGKVVKFRNGTDGVLEKEFYTVYFGGKKITEELLGEKVVKPAVSQLYETGQASFDGEYLKKYTMIATAYSPHAIETDGNPWVTATGLRSGVGVVAVDPNVIPLGSLLYVKGYGYAVAGDTGGAIKGDIIDVFFYSTDDALQWGRRAVTVYLLPGKWKFPSKLDY